MASTRSSFSLPPIKQYPRDARVAPDETGEGNPEQPIVYCHADPPSNTAAGCLAIPSQVIVNPCLTSARGEIFQKVQFWENPD